VPLPTIFATYLELALSCFLFTSLISLFTLISPANQLQWQQVLTIPFFVLYFHILLSRLFPVSSQANLGVFDSHARENFS